MVATLRSHRMPKAPELEAAPVQLMEYVCLVTESSGNILSLKYYYFVASNFCPLVCSLVVFFTQNKHGHELRSHWASPPLVAQDESFWRWMDCRDGVWW